MLLRFAAIVTLVAAVYFLQRAADPIFEQNAKVRQWPAVDVTVTARVVDVPAPLTAPAGADGAAPGRVPATRTEVELRHEIAGQVFRTRRFNPRPEEWAPAAPDLATTREASFVRRGHYDPERPGQAFIPKAFGFRDYLPVFVWAPLFALGFGGLLLGKARRAAAAVPLRGGRGERGERGEKTWYRVPPKQSTGHRARVAWSVAVVCNVLLGLAAYDYFGGEPRARSGVGDVLVCLGMLPGVATIGLAAYYSRVARRIGEPTVRVDTVRLRPGDRLTVKIDLPPSKRDIDGEHVIVVVGLICVRAAREQTDRDPRWGEQELHAERAERSVGGRHSTSGGRVTFEQRFRVPPDAEPSSISHAGLRGPRVDWFVEIHIRPSDGAEYRGRFPLTVFTGETAAPASGK